MSRRNTQGEHLTGNASCEVLLNIYFTTRIDISEKKIFYIRKKSVEDLGNANFACTQNNFLEALVLLHRQGEEALGELIQRRLAFERKLRKSKLRQVR